jgi:BirA family biotin operon repressor/biotin-[acetyl-CoA-carboxylase] ligase
LTEAYFTSARAIPEPHMPAGWRVRAYAELDSTNSALKRLVEQGADVAEGELIWAKSQTAGRGRSGRTWVSPPGNVYASYLIEAPADSAAAPQLGFVAARAVVETILDLPRHNTAPPRVTCKWPNDVLIEGEKVCGILPELASDPEGRNWVIVGIGIDVEPVEVANPTYPVTALKLHHIDTTPAHVLTVLSRTLDQWLGVWRAQGFAAIRKAWLECGPAIGSPVSVNPGSGAVSGAFAGLDADGALLLDTPEGRRRIVAGDVLMGDA